MSPLVEGAGGSVSGLHGGRCRLLYLVGELHKGGLERQLYYLLREIDRERYSPAVVVWNYRDSDLHVPLLRAIGVPIYSLATANSRLEKLRAFRRLVGQLRPEVIHSYNFYTNFAASWGAVGRTAVAIGSVRNAFVWSKHDSGPLVGRLSARWPSNQIFNSFAAAEEVPRARTMFAPKHVAVVTNAIDLVRFRSSAAPCSVPTQILGVGYLRPAKRWDRVLGAAAELKRNGLDCRIRIVGGGPLLRELQQHASKLGVVDRVQFVPHSDDIPGLLAGAAFLTHTADNEGSPNAVMEAMACGRAVVATEVGDIPRLVDDGVTGFLVKPGDGAQLAERMAALANDPELCSRMGEAARRKAERDFGLDRLVRETLDSYRKAGWDTGRRESLMSSATGGQSTK
jgi:glycosyltransferase involved in cell wall biosynthesis